MKKLFLGALLAVLSLETRADVVFSQPPSASGGLIGSSWIDPGGSDADMYAYDSFMVASNAPITEVRWRGGYIYGAPYGRATDFTVTFFESIAGGWQPHITNPQLEDIYPVYLAKLRVGSNAGETLAGTFGGTTMYDYRFVLPTPFQAVAGKKYWLRIEASQIGYPDWGIALGTGGDGQHFAFSTGAARFWFGSGDTAFTLLAPPGPYFTVATSADPGGCGSTSGDGVYTNGANVSVVAAANAGYAFVNWTDNGIPVSTSATYNFPATRNRALTATFAPAFAIATSASPVNGGTSTGDGSYTYGSSVTVLATPNANFAFVNWTENGAPVSVADHYTFTASASRTLLANFVPANPNVNSVFTQPHDGSGTVMKSAWYSPDGLDGDVYVYDSFLLSSNQAITEIDWRGGYVNFLSGAGESPVYDFTISIYGPGLVDSEPALSPMRQYSVGGNAGETLAGTFGGVPMYDYKFVLPTAFNAVGGTKYWVQIEASQGLTPTYYWPPDWGLAAGTGGNGSHFQVIIGGTAGGGNARQIRANDTAFTLLAAASGYSITTIASPANGGAMDGGGVYTNGASVTVIATPNPGYVFVSWNEHGSPVSTSTNFHFTAHASRTLVASFAQAFTIATSASPGGGGSTSGGGVYNGGSDVSVVATANPGHVFVNWTEGGAEVSASASYYFTADADRTLVANFTPIYTIATSVSPVSSGFTSGGGVYTSGASVTVMPTPNPGYAFVNWTEGGVPVSTWAGYNFTADANRILVANFAPVCAITTSAAPTNGGWTSGGVYPSGAVAAVAATPTTGYTFVNWTENGSPVSTSASYSFTAGSNRVLVANFAPDTASVTFDFDTSSPALTNGQPTPFSQTSSGLTASFSATNDPAFSIQSDTSTLFTLSRFSGNYLYPGISGSALDIQFSQPVSRITLTFATFDFQQVLTPSTIRLTAYQDSAATPAVGTATALGNFAPGDAMPMGTLTLSSATPFNLVRIELPSAPLGATDLIVDNITVLMSNGVTNVAPPRLTLSLTSTNTALLSWSTNSPGFVLQHNSACHATNWVDVTNAVEVVGDQNQVILPAPPEPRFFRLMHP